LRVRVDAATTELAVFGRHPSETLKPKTLKSILDQAGLTPDEFRNLL
jgi:predicted RNA binding protein YcfA (HicA-like mRNA interferase family)